MGLISKTVKIIPKSKQVTYFKKLGYVFNKGDEIEVQVSELSAGSRIPVQCSCDYCGDILCVPYKEYRRNIGGIIPKYSCNKCKGKKIVESNLLTYGVRIPSELPEVREKVRKTNNERYGHDSYSQTDEYIERVKATNLRKYGYEWNASSPEIREKMIATLHNNYGVDAPYKSKIIQDRRIETMLNRYGFENASQVPEFQEKKKQSCLQTIGYEYALQSPEIREHVKSVVQERFGVDYATQSPEIQDKIRETNRQRYHCDNPLQNPEIQAKTRKTNLQKYGCEHVSQSPEIRAKAAMTMNKNQTVTTSTQQKYLSELYNMRLNAFLVYWNVDMYDDINDIALEFDGGGHFLAIEIGGMSPEAFYQKELVREKLIREDGHKLIRIISKTDKLPSDEILLQMLSDAKQYFSDFPQHTWMNFDIDNGIYRNAEHKDGSPYFYGQLRRIKASDLKSA